MSKGRRRWLIRSLCLLPLLPFALIHALSLAMDRIEALPPGAHVEDKPIPEGFRVRLYSLPRPNSHGSLILVHGTPGSASAWIAQFRHPPPGWTLYSYDRPGFGFSGGARDNPDLDFQVRVLDQALLQANPRRPLLLVGHSYGAPIALRAALDYPDRIDGVLSIGGAVDPDQEDTYAVQRFAAFPFVRWALPAKARVSNGELLTLEADLRRMAGQWNLLQCPVLMLHGDHDTNVPVANVTYLENALRRAGKGALFGKRVYAEVNHFIPWERPDLVTKALSELEATVKERGHH